METTLAKIKAHDPCQDGWKTLLKYLGKARADDEPLSILTILESNGVDDALWALRAVEGQDRIIRHFAADCAERVLPIFERDFPGDDRPRKAIQAARDFADGKITSEELAAAETAAMAAETAARAARATAWAAETAAWAAWAARAARAAWTAWTAAEDAEREWQARRLLQYCEHGESAIGMECE